MATPVETITGMLPTLVAAKAASGIAGGISRRRRAQVAAPVRRKARRAKPKAVRATKRKVVKRKRR